MSADLGDDLVEGSGAATASGPVLTQQGDIVIVTQPQGASQPTLILRLAQNVTWRIELDGGASAARLNLVRGRVSAVDITAGVSSLDIALPAPRGTLPVTLTGGASSLQIAVAGAAPVRATMGGGASTVRLYGTTTTGVAGGTRLESPGWRQSDNRVSVNCTAGVSSLVVRPA